MAYAEAHHIPVYIFYNKTQTEISAMLNGNAYFKMIPYEKEADIYSALDGILK